MSDIKKDLVESIEVGTPYDLACLPKVNEDWGLPPGELKLESIMPTGTPGEAVYEFTFTPTPNLHGLPADLGERFLRCVHDETHCDLCGGSFPQESIAQSTAECVMCKECMKRQQQATDDGMPEPDVTV